MTAASIALIALGAIVVLLNVALYLCALPSIRRRRRARRRFAYMLRVNAVELASADEVRRFTRAGV